MIKPVIAVQLVNYSDEGLYFRVGLDHGYFNKDGEWVEGKVTKIEMVDDVPGLHCYLWRICVYIDDVIMYEAPYTSTAFVQHREEENNAE